MSDRTRELKERLLGALDMEPWSVERVALAKKLLDAWAHEPDSSMNMQQVAAIRQFERTALAYAACLENLCFLFPEESTRSQAVVVKLDARVVAAGAQDESRVGTVVTHPCVHVHWDNGDAVWVRPQDLRAIVVEKP